MPNVNRPMLAADYDEERLVFPCYASYKLDGYRAYNQNGNLLTRSGELVTNEFTQALFSGDNYAGLDGELIVGQWNLPNTFHNTSGPVRKKIGEPAVRWFIFDDRTNPEQGFASRQHRARTRIDDIRFGRNPPRGASSIEFLDHTLITTREELEAFEQHALANHFEGVMIRSLEGPYKFGRSTLNEGYLLKVKRYQSDEATIVDVEEQMTNNNPAELDALGFTKRSENKDGLTGAGMIGAFVVQSPKWEKSFKISAGGMTHEEKREGWHNRQTFIGQLARFKYFPHGTLDVPRHGLFEGLRDIKDLD